MLASALWIIQQAAGELGLPVPTEALASNDATAKQFAALLNSAGYEMAYGYNWQQLDKLGEITTVANQDTYPLPDDFARLVNQTFWSVDQQLEPSVGPISPQIWQAFVNGSLGSGPTQRFRIQGNNIVIGPTPGEDGLKYNYEYQSNAWLKDASGTNQYISALQNDNDEPIFDAFLMVKYLKVKMWSAKGLNTDNLQIEFVRMFDMLTSGNKGADVLSLSHGRRSNYISGRNVPEGNWNT